MPDTPVPEKEIRPDPDPVGAAGPIPRAAASAVSALLRSAFHLLYHQFAFAYDAVAWIVSAGEWAEWRRSVVPYLVPGPLLEIAHGTGTLSLDLADRGYMVTAIDLSPAMGKIARGKIRRLRRRIGAAPDRSAHEPRLVRADVTRLPFPPGRFASAVATFPAEFIFQPQTLREAFRVLHPAGRWIILPTAFPEWFAKRWLPEDSRLASGGMLRSWFSKLEECGFRVRTEIVHRPRSRVLLILAEKPR
jgi:ubiquinone/menaquinone biosynthesis C-methylase UbiE